MKSSFQIAGTFDIECTDWNQFILGATYDGKKGKIFYDGDQMIDEMRRQGGVWFSHAGGVYDMLFVLDRALQREIPCQSDRSQHRVTRVVMGNLTLRDSWAIWPAPLDDLCGAIRAPVPKLPYKCKCGRSCGGYCQITIKSALGDPKLEKYCLADTRRLYDALQHLARWCARNQIALRGTLGQTAWKSAQEFLGIENSTMPWHLWRLIRQADKGGRGAIVRPFSTPGEVGAHHDICSAYPAQLARAELPVGACRELGGNDAERAFHYKRPGIYSVSVSVPEMFLPPLPWSKLGQLCFPTGDFSGSWPLPELLFAMERGVEVTAVRSAVVWEAQVPVFSELVGRWYEIRRKTGKKTPLGDWIGNLSKAVTGKLAERPERERVSMYPDKIKVCMRVGSCRGGCTKRCGAYEQLDLFGDIWGIPYQRMADSAYPHWSSYLRAMTRMQWLSQAERMGEVIHCGSCGEILAPGSVCSSHPSATPSRSGGGRALRLGNTDSLWHTSRQPPEPLGDGMGQWEYKHPWTDLEVRTLTIYAYRDPSGEDPSKLNIRGIPGLTEKDWRRGSGEIDRGIVTFGRAVKTTKGLFQKRQRKWKLPRHERVWYGDRKLHSDGFTYPASADDLRDLAREVEERRKERARRNLGDVRL